MRLYRLATLPLATLLSLACLSIPAFAEPATNSLRMEITVSGNIRLNWEAGTGPYGVFRATIPGQVTDPISYIGITSNLSFEEILPPSGLVYYRVVDPPDCGVGPCTGPLETLELPPNANGRRAVDEDDVAYVAAGPAGLVTMDIADPSAVVVLGNLSGLGDCNDIVKIGNYVNLACGNSGTRVVSVIDPANPSLQTTLPQLPGFEPDAVSVASLANMLYVGVGSRMQIWNVNNPANPIFWTSLEPGVVSPVVRVRVDGARLYCLHADGALAIYNATRPPFPVHEATIPTSPSAVDLAVRDGIAYCAYDGAGVQIFDVRDPAAPALLWWDGGSSATGIDVRNRTMVAAYADGRVVTRGLSDPSSPQVLSASITTSSPSGVAMFGNGTAWCAYGSTASLIDIPPFVLSQLPRSGTTGLCGANDVLLQFSSAILAETVDEGSVAVTQAGVPVNGSRAVNGTEVAFTPEVGSLGLGDYEVRVDESIRNHRGTQGPYSGFQGTFHIDAACTQWTSTPVSMFSGTPALFGFDVLGGTIVGPEVLVSSHPDPADPFAISDVVPAAGGPTSFSAQWTAPAVPVSTTHYAVVRGTMDGQVASTSVVDFLVNCSPDCTGQSCGGDGCGGSCGTCAGGVVCDCAGVCGGLLFLDLNYTCCPASHLDCENMCGGDAQIGSGGQCCHPIYMDACGFCDGDGVGGIGCAPGDCAGFGSCECNVCNCPAPYFGNYCDCLEKAIEYNGLYQSSYIQATDDTLLLTEKTVEGWIFPTHKGAPIFSRLSANGGVVWALSTGDVGNALGANYIHLFNGGVCPTCNAYGNTPVPVNEWTHVAFVWDAVSGNAKFYFNGLPDGEQPFSPGAISSGQLVVAALGTQYFGGKMDDLRMWKSTRSDLDILSNYDVSLPGTGVLDLVFNHNMQKWTSGDLASIDYSPASRSLVHNLFVVPVDNVAPAPLSTTPEGCPSNCNGAGTCECGICTCFFTNDLTFDCGFSGGTGFMTHKPGWRLPPASRLEDPDHSAAETETP